MHCQSQGLNATVSSLCRLLPPPSWIFRKANLTSAEVAGGLYLPLYQLWWRYLKGRPSYGDLCFQNGGRPPFLIFAEVKFGNISVYGTSVLVSVPNFMRICGIATELWPLKWILKMASAAILDFSEVKFYVSWSSGRPVSTSTPNLVKICQRASELRRFMCFQYGGRPPSWILADVKFGGISVSGTSVLFSVPNFMRICGIATELWPLKWILKWRPQPSWIFGSEIWRQLK